MVIWSRLGILALLVPGVLMIAARTVSQGWSEAGWDPPPLPRAANVDADDEEAAARRAEEVRAAKQAQEAERLAVMERAKRRGDGIGLLLAAGLVWPLGRWMNWKDTHVAHDPISGDPVEVRTGGGHTLFFIPMEYWAFFWAALGLYRLL